MKELSIEEKAKRYDEAIERAESIYNETAIPSATTKGICTYIFPELKESEDDRMIQYFKDLAPFDKADELYEKYGFSHKDAIAWLEKQCEQKIKTPEESLGIDSDTYNKIVDECIYGEQKPADKVEPKFKVGDWAVEIAREELMEEFIGKAIIFLEGAHEYIDDKKLQLQYDNEGLIRDFRQFMREQIKEAMKDET